MKVYLTALSAKAIHKTLAPWCLKAYCDTHVPGCHITVGEHTVNDHLSDIVKEIYQKAPDVLGLSVYIWNEEQVVKLATMIKKYLPKCIIVLGGPQVSFEENLEHYPMADYLIQGAGEACFAKLLKAIQLGEKPASSLITAENSPHLDTLPSPYTQAYYDSFTQGRMLTIENQLIYFESLRGCPFSCTYCLSSSFQGVEELSLNQVYNRLDALIEKGAKCIKFVDRTFNANRKRAGEIFRYLLAKDTSCTFHFEVAADLFDLELLELVSQMPKERVQFEIGIQSTNSETLKEICRTMDIEKVLKTIETLVSYGNCHIHVDLIAGLPFETMESFSKGIDACIRAKPHMLQLGFLKLLKGTKIREQAREYGYVYHDFVPYQVFSSATMSFDHMITLGEIEEIIEKFYNSGTFTNTIEYLLEKVFERPYTLFVSLAEFAKDENPKISQKHAYSILYNFACQHIPWEVAAHVIKKDCLTYYAKNVIPDAIETHRQKAMEQECKKSVQPFYTNVRIEYFPYTGETLAFIYDEKCHISGRHKIEIWEKA